MNQKKQTGLKWLLIVLSTIGLIAILAYRTGRQQQRNHALIHAIHSADSQAILAALKDGADGNA